jgi:hypothetical protein
MKKIFFVIILSNFAFLQITDAQKITKLEITYLPWDYHVLGRLTEEDVRNFNPKHKKFSSITDTLIIHDFIKSMSVFYLIPFDGLQDLEPRMIINVFFEKSQRTILLDRKQHLKYQDRFYFKNFELAKWIDKNIFVQ